MKKIIFICMTVLGIGYAQAQTPSSALRQKHYNAQDHLMLSGYDAVAYITQGKAVLGKKIYACSYQGQRYYFSTDANRGVFLSKPEAYEPQYGGWCAYAMGESGEKVEVDPKTFKVLEGKLYLFYNFYFTNTLTKWNEHEAVLKSKADKNWKLTLSQ
jgi:YHS domain-containing protein